jgi:hypothetical protein
MALVARFLGRALRSLTRLSNRNQRNLQNGHAKRLECVQLAGAVAGRGWLESGSKLHALQTLRAVRWRFCRAGSRIPEENRGFRRLETVGLGSKRAISLAKAGISLAGAGIWLTKPAIGLTKTLIWLTESGSWLTGRAIWLTSMGILGAKLPGSLAKTGRARMGRAGGKSALVRSH